jgi:undecaprenyl-diphosphatase
MPADLTIFAAKYLVFIDAVVAIGALALLLRHQPLSRLLWWGIAASSLLVLSYIFAHIGAAVYTDPRPFTTDHVRPLIPHAADNGFPSDHALLAAAIVAVIAIVNLWVAIPFAILAGLIDWARVGSGLHHVVDVIGSSLFVVAATLIALLIAPRIVRWLTPYVPQQWLARTSDPAHLRGVERSK